MKHIENEETPVRRCVACGRPLRLGFNTMKVAAGVIGPRGFLDLEEHRLYCNRDCLIEGEQKRKTDCHQSDRWRGGVWKQDV